MLCVNWDRATIPICDPQTGEVHEAPLFVTVLGSSNCTYAEAKLGPATGFLDRGAIRAFEFLGGCPELAVPGDT
jgi:transposase